jgi:hypothetical protein
MVKKVGDEYFEQVTISEPIPAGTNTIGVVDAVYGGLTYLGEQTITGNSANQNATLPTGTNMVLLSAESGAMRFTINAAATANSGGYVPENTQVWIIKLANLTSLGIYGVSPAKVHITYYQEP